MSDSPESLAAIGSAGGGNEPIVHRFDDGAALASEMARRIADRLATAIAVREKATLVLSGGRTPIPFFEQLRQRTLPWARLVITLADERWVSATSADSNERLVRDHLLQGDAGMARFFGLKNAAPTPHEGLPNCSTMLGQLPRPYDVVVLGMGDDGHFASLFPDTSGLAAALDPYSEARCVAVNSPSAQYQRMSQTLAALVDARLLVLHIEGERKWRRYREALDSGPARELPARALLGQQRTPVEVYWAP
ncbi:MAG: 6-phosphogluconolactonase [Pseudomonadota bacterium]|nr:6-phosphogluconolactonase [Pseudomonadota bacterium]